MQPSSNSSPAMLRSVSAAVPNPPCAGWLFAAFPWLSSPLASFHCPCVHTCACVCLHVCVCVQVCTRALPAAFVSLSFDSCIGDAPSAALPCLVPKHASHTQPPPPISSHSIHCQHHYPQNAQHGSEPQRLMDDFIQMAWAGLACWQPLPGLAQPIHPSPPGQSGSWKDVGGTLAESDGRPMREAKGSAPSSSPG